MTTFVLCFFFGSDRCIEVICPFQVLSVKQFSRLTGSTRKDPGNTTAANPIPNIVCPSVTITNLSQLVFTSPFSDLENFVSITDSGLVEPAFSEMWFDDRPDLLDLLDF